MPNLPRAGPTRAHAMLLAGRSLRDLHDNDTAVAAFRNVIALGQGDEAQARLGLARTLTDQNKIAEALTEYNQLISVDDSNVAAAAMTEAAAIHRRLAEQERLAGHDATVRGELHEAQRLLLRLVLLMPFPELSPTPELAYLNLAEVLTQLGQPADALKEWQELADKFPNGPYASYAKAMIAINQHRKGDGEFILKSLHGQQLDPQLAEKVTRSLKAVEEMP